MTPTEADERAYPPLPEPSLTSYSTDSIMRRYEHRSYTADQLREYLDADRAARASSPPVPQPGAEVRRYCNKCGYTGPDMEHQRPNGTGECGYLAPALSSQPQPRKLSEEEIRKWWASYNGLEDCYMCKVDDFRQVVRAFENKYGITATGNGESA